MRPYTQLHPLALLLLARLHLALAHSDHSFDLNDGDDAGMPYAERHVSDVLDAGVLSSRSLHSLSFARLFSSLRYIFRGPPEPHP